MCGILGYSGTFVSTILQSGMRTIAHRGPDDSGMFVDEACGIGLGHTRLSILELSDLGHQPMLGADGNVVLIFNGEIYNFRELRTELERKGYMFRGNSDTEVLLNLYLDQGVELLPQLNGIFVFALWDSRNRLLLLARDGLGVKPLYFAETNSGMVFASEIKALLHLSPELCQLDMVALHRYLNFLWCPGEGTPLKSVRKLGPGEAITVRDGRIKERWIWYQLPAFCGVTADLSEIASIEGTVSHIRQAVQRQMVADVPVGAFLSGGLDSSTIVAMSREFNPTINCFTIEVTGGQDTGEADDLPYARRVAKHLNVPLEVVRIDAQRMAHDLERMVIQLDEPLGDPAPLNVLYISQLAREHGMKVLLSGAGGDDLFTGYRRHRAVIAEPYWAWLPRVARKGLERLSGTLDQRSSVGRRLRKLFSGADLEGNARLVNYFIWNRREDLFALYAPGFRAAIGNTEAAAPMLEFLAELPANGDPVERMLALEQRFFLADHNLLYTDKMSMAAGVEVRVPYLDLELVAFSQKIPTRYKQRGGEGKWVLKKAMEPYLPKDVIYRSKTSFGAPLRRWLQHELRPLLHDLLSADSIRRRGLFDPIAVQNLIRHNEEGKVDSSYTLLSLLCIEIWCRHFIDAT